MSIVLVFLPLIAAIIVGLNSRTIAPRLAQLITSGAIGISAILSAIVFYQVAILGNTEVIEIIPWIRSEDLEVYWSIKLDSLSAIMLVVVTWVSTLVHIYSIGYMSHDPHIPRFMAYLSLFTFFMLMLVTANDFAQLFLGWEGVGLCSYLLIGFWYKKPSANAAAIKAFIVNRVGDFGFALGIFAIFMVFNTLKFDLVFSQVETTSHEFVHFLGYEIHALTLICLLLFIGAMGKSAQLGLHTWLPDAMEGPTPVSALIHAATMVTAGVFLVARCSPLFEFAPDALALVTIVGATTALFAGTIAITQNDIKRVIAYSTCSQLGYMFFACGVSAYAAGVFHLFTHAFFKALLFLGAGSVIHAMSDEQDMRKMGGIWRKIPVTYVMMLIGTLAIIGFPFLAGYYSKDIIMEAAYAAGTHSNVFGQYAYWVGIAAAVLTSVYSWRLVFMTFHGKSRASKAVLQKIHESPKIMTIPLAILALGAIFSGAIGYYGLDIVGEEMKFWYSDSGSSISFSEILHHAHHVPVWVKLSPLGAAILGFCIAYLFYILYPKLPARISETFSPIYKFLYNKWYFDELYDFLFVKSIKKLGLYFWKIWDIKIINGLGPDGVAYRVRKAAVNLGFFQSGYVFFYAFVMIIGMLVFISYYVNDYFNVW